MSRSTPIDGYRSKATPAPSAFRVRLESGSGTITTFTDPDYVTINRVYDHYLNLHTTAFITLLGPNGVVLRSDIGDSA